MDQGHHHHHPHHMSVSVDTSGGGGNGGGGGGGGGDRFPQWSIQETRDFLMIRAEFDPTFMETKRNKLLWEVFSNKMKEMGYNRSPDQCKCKWKNLVTRYKNMDERRSPYFLSGMIFTHFQLKSENYEDWARVFKGSLRVKTKTAFIDGIIENPTMDDELKHWQTGCETMEPAEGMRQQFPYYNELQAIFSARMQRMLWLEAEGGGTSGSKKKNTLSSDEEDENEESDGEHQKARISLKKKRKITTKGVGTSGNTTNNNNNNNNLREILEEFTKQQMEIEMQWMKIYEAREEERKVKEMEWRQRMEALENERIMMDRRWREREEQRRVREEARAEKRDALITALLNKLRREDHI